MEKIKRMDIKEFRAKGFLQEANRKFFHPLGLALEVIVNDDIDEESLGGVWDYREDKDGMFFQPAVISKDKVDYVETLRKSKIEHRKNNECGYVKVNENGIQVI